MPEEKGLRDEYARSLEPARSLAAEANKLEHEIRDLINAAYGVKPNEIALPWDTAPPRTPIVRPMLVKEPHRSTRSGTCMASS